MPRCWTKRDDWVEWNRLDELARDKRARVRDHFCTDCLPEFQDKMKADGRCAHLTVTFVKIVEHRFDAILRKRKFITTDALKGVRDHEKTGHH